MKTLISATLMIFASSCFALGPTAAKKRAPQSTKDNCKAKVERLVRQTAHAMGMKSDFGLNMTSSVGGLDMQDRPLTKYVSGVFIVEDGYQSDSGATVVVRSQSCDVIKLSVSIGG